MNIKPEEIRQNRLVNLHFLRKKHGNDITANLARKLNKDQNQLRMWFNPEKKGGRWIGEKAAREIEEILRNKPELPSKS